MPHGDGLSEKAQQRQVAALPRHGGAVFFLLHTLNAKLVSVENGGHSHKAHHKQDGKAIACGIPAAQRQETADVVAVQQIQLRREHLQPVAHEHIRNTPGEFCCVDALFGEKSAAVLPEIVVHGGVEHVPLKPVTGAFPDLADQQRFRILAFDRTAERPPEAIVDLAGHVQPPAVDAVFPHPVSAHVTEVFLHLRICGIQLRHHAFIGEAGVVRNFLRGFGAMHGEGQIIEPVFVAGFLLILDHILKGEEMPAAVIEHAVDDDPNARSVQRIDHSPECLIPAEAGVNVVIIQQIILVVFPGGEDRIQIHAVDAQRFQVIHIPRNPVQRPAELSPHGLLSKTL